MRKPLALPTRKAKETAPVCVLVFVLSILAAHAAFAQPKKTDDPAKTGPPKAATPQAGAGSLTLGEYLTQVSDKHSGYKAADLTARGAKLYSEEGSLLLKPQVTANAQTSTEGRNNPFVFDKNFHSKLYSLGLSQATGIGLNSKLTYNRMEMQIPTGQASTSWSPDWLQLDLSQSLWRNWAGHEIAAQAEVIETAALAKAHGQTYASKAILLEAEAAYWRLALAREMVKMNQDAIARAQRIADWAGRRTQLSLVDRAESLQASTNLQARKLDLRTAEDEVRAAAQAFNSSRGVNSNEVSEQLIVIDPVLISSMTVPERTVRRDDIRAAEFQARAAAASANASKEKDKPVLELFASAPLTEPAAAPGLLAAALPANQRPSTTVGVRFSAPLDFGVLSRAREGYAAEAAAAEHTLARKVFEEERDWADLTAKFMQSRERLKLYTELEKTQKEKLDYERDRQRRGRSTLQQVLIYETDFQMAQLGRIRTLAELLTLNAQMKLYGVSYESR